MGNTNTDQQNIGDLVFSEPSGDYGCLVGKVIGITPLGSPEHDTGNETDDIHVDFFAPYSIAYSETRKAEIAQEFTGLYCRQMKFDELPLDDVIMPPESLISLYGADFTWKSSLLKSRQEAEGFYEKHLSGTVNRLRDQLFERVEKSFSDYHALLGGFGKQELIDMASKIAAMSDARDYMTKWHSFGLDELQFFLQFHNPLEVVAEEWRERNTNLEDMGYTMDYINEQKPHLLTQYPLVDDTDELHDTALRRFMGVDIIDFLGKIAEKVIVHYPNDWNIDKKQLADKAVSGNPEDLRLIWHVCSMGTHIRNERDVFISGSGAFEYMTDYRQNDPDMFGYVVEITGMDGDRILGNVFDVGNYAEYAAHIRDVSLPLATLTLTYSDSWGVNAGRAITVSRREYDEDRPRLMSESGDVRRIRCHPADESELAETLRLERSRRMAFPIGSCEAHVSHIIAKVDEIRKPQVDTPANAKPKLSDKLQAANDKAKAQGALANKSKSRKREERE